MRKALAFIRRDFLIQASYRLDFIMRVFGILVSVAIFNYISRFLGGNIDSTLQDYGSDYFHFALIGIAFFPLVNLSTEILSKAITEYQTTGTLEVLFLSPTPILPSLMLSTLWGYCWAFMESLFFLISAAIFFSADLNWASVLPATLIVLAAILANTGLGLINAAFVLITKRNSPLIRLMVLMTYLLAGVYFPVEILPGWLRFVSNLLPSTYSLNALRRTLLNVSALSEISQDLLALGLFSLVLLPLGFISFYFAVRWAKTDGSLSVY